MEDKMISGARIILECLSRLGVKDIFGYPGGAVIPFYDELYNYKNLKHYFARHEQGAAHEADGYARASGKAGVCLATSGPGATNLVTGIMTAHMDSIPLIAITGQVTSDLLGKDAFQEADIVGITVPITKNNYLVQNIRELPHIIREAHYIATTGRPGPVLVDVPKDIQLSKITYDEFEKLYNKKYEIEGYDPTYNGHPVQIKKAVKEIQNAKKPLIIAGAGILKAGAAKELRDLAENLNIPVTMTLLGLGSLPTKHELSLGMLGMHGTVYANYATAEADLIIAAGIRFDDRITGNPDKFCKNAKIIHIDIDPAEIGKNKKPDIPIVGDLKNVLEEMNNALKPKEHKEWIEQIEEWKQEYPLVYKKKDKDKLCPQEVLEKIDSIINGNAIIATDVGQHQMWAAQFLSYNKPNSICTSGGAGTMGFGLPAAIGAQVAKPDEKVIAIVGDGGFQMTLQELMVVKEYNLPVKIVILNNSYLGMVRQWQEMFNEKRYSFVDLTHNPDFVKIGEAYGIKSVKLSKPEDLSQLEDLLNSNEAVLIDCVVEKEENVLPMIPAGTSVDQIVGKKGEI